MTDPTPSPARGRLLVAAAAALWSLSGYFKCVLTQPTGLGLHDPPLDELQIAFYRGLFAGLVLAPSVRVRDVRFRPAMVPMVVSFALMNWLYMSAMVGGTAANAVLLQYTAPLWVLPLSVLLLGEPVDRRGLGSVALGTLGVAVIVAGNWGHESPRAVSMAVGSGAAYAGILVFLRLLRDESPAWLTALNHLGAAVLLSVTVWGKPPPTAGQFVFLALFGAVQMGLPYWLIARGLRSVGPQEAGVITLLEPVLCPLWAYLAVGETPRWPAFVGGPLILLAVAGRFAPAGRRGRMAAEGER